MRHRFELLSVYCTSLFPPSMSWGLSFCHLQNDPPLLSVMLPSYVDYTNRCKQTDPTSGRTAACWSDPRHSQHPLWPADSVWEEFEVWTYVGLPVFCWRVGVREHMGHMPLKVSLINKGERRCANLWELPPNWMSTQRQRPPRLRALIAIHSVKKIN